MAKDQAAAAGSATAASAPVRPNPLARARSASIERVNAVVRALARPASDPSADEDDDDDEYDDSDYEGAKATGVAAEGQGLFVKTSPEELSHLAAQSVLRNRTAGNGVHSSNTSYTASTSTSRTNVAHQQGASGEAPHSSTTAATTPGDEGKSPNGSILGADDELSDHYGYSAQSSPHPLLPSTLAMAGGTSSAMSSRYAQGWQSPSNSLQGSARAPAGTTSSLKLSQEEKELGRLRREELRAKKDGKRKRKSKSSSSAAAPAKGTIEKVKKSWEIPRKIFHSSIGFLVLYLHLSHHPLEKIVSGLSAFLGVVVTADIIRLNSPPFERLYERVLGFLMRESEKKQVNGVVWYLIGVITSLHVFPADIACVSIMILSWCDTCASVFGRLFGKHTPPLPSPPFATRKSLAGFLAALASGTLTAFFFWGTSIAIRGERAHDGLSWHPARPAIFGTPNAPGAFGSGWIDFKHGISGRPLGGATSYLSRAAASVASSSSLAGSGLTWSSTSPAMPIWLLSVGSGAVAAVSESLELGGLDDNLTLPILSATGIYSLLWAWGRVATWLGW